MAVKIVSYPLDFSTQLIEMPLGTSIFGVGTEEVELGNADYAERPVLYAFLGTEVTEMIKRKFHVLSTGQEVPTPGVVYVGSGRYKTGHTVHVFEHVA